MSEQLVRRAMEIEINAAREDLRRITSMPRAQEFERPVEILRDGLYYELGIAVPAVRWRAREDLPAGHCGFRILGEPTRSYPLLSPDELVVNIGATELPVAVVRAASDPDGGTSWSVVSSAAVRELRSMRDAFNTWDALEYAVFLLAAELRSQAASLVTPEWVERELERFRTSSPALVELCRARFELDQIQATLAGLVAERVSIRNLPMILERLVDFDRVVADDTHNLVFDPRLPVRAEDLTRAPSVREFVDHVRAGLAAALTFAHTHETNTLRVYLLSPDIEAHLEQQRRRQARPDQVIARGLVEAVARETGNHGSKTVILTTSYVRHSVRMLIADEFPWLAVLAYNELDPSCNILPISRISLD